MASSADAIFDKSALSPRERVTDWVNIKGALGTRVAGKFLGYWPVPARGVYKAQVALALEDLDNPEKVYGINLPEYFKDTLATYLVGDACGFEYFKDIPAKEAGLSATKAIRSYNLAKKERDAAGQVVNTEAGEAAEDTITVIEEAETVVESPEGETAAPGGAEQPW